MSKSLTAIASLAALVALASPLPAQSPNWAKVGWAYQPSRFNGCSDPDALDEVRIRALTVRLVPLWSIELQQRQTASSVER